MCCDVASDISHSHVDCNEQKGIDPPMLPSPVSLLSGIRNEIGIGYEVILWYGCVCRTGTRIVCVQA